MSKQVLAFKKPKTAYGLLRMIQKEIIKEPKRVNMDFWLAKGIEQMQVQGINRDLIPQCKTVGCIAGWGKTIVCPTSRRQPMKIMAELLGFECPDTYEREDNSVGRLFYTTCWPRDLEHRLDEELPGTIGYALVVVERIEQFINEHKSHLRRQTIA